MMKVTILSMASVATAIMTTDKKVSVKGMAKAGAIGLAVLAGKNGVNAFGDMFNDCISDSSTFVTTDCDGATCEEELAALEIDSTPLDATQLVCAESCGLCESAPLGASSPAPICRDWLGTDRCLFFVGTRQQHGAYSVCELFGIPVDRNGVTGLIPLSIACGVTCYEAGCNSACQHL